MLILPSCDACRKRKICCTRDAYEKACSLCKTRSESCSYILPPNVRRNRQAPTRNSAINKTSNRATSDVNSKTPKTPKAAATEWISQFVGLSGDQDPFVLRHCSFNQLNCYKAPDWACIRIKGDGEIPLHFTVSDLEVGSHMTVLTNYS